jgi:crotonobetainyl-CoA:carnitine CoA-transferase CaiB-like acyl-CoA transferase
VRPFEGIRVIDCTHVLAGPYATYNLALLGADVIRIENPDDPDQSRLRAFDPKFADELMGLSFMTQGSNKRSVTLNLKTAQGRDILKKLALTADIMVENFRPGAMAKLGLGYDDMAKINPRLIYVSMSGFGQVGPRREQTATDHVIQATSGLMGNTGTPETAPIIAGAAVTDYATGAVGAFAMASALLQRNHTGKGQHVDVAMIDVAMALLNNHVVSYLRGGPEPKPNGNNFDRATTGVYQTKDGLVMVAAVNMRQQKRLWELLGRPELVKNTERERVADYVREHAALAEIMLTKTAAEWETYLQENHIAAGRVRKLSEAANDPHIAARGYFQRVAVPGFEGEVALPLTPFRMQDGGAKIDRPPARMGEHNDEVLKELGFDAATIEDFRKAGVFGKA